MAALFFLMAFVNTISDSMKDSLVITAAGGGTHVIPYLTGGCSHERMGGHGRMGWHGRGWMGAWVDGRAYAGVCN